MPKGTIFGTSLLKGEERLYLARMTIRDGEYEYLEESFIKANNLESAEAKATDYARSNFDDELATPVDYAPGWYEEVHGYRWIRVNSVREMDSLEEAIQTIGIIE